MWRRSRTPNLRIFARFESLSSARHRPQTCPLPPLSVGDDPPRDTSLVRLIFTHPLAPPWDCVTFTRRRRNSYMANINRPVVHVMLAAPRLLNSCISATVRPKALGRVVHGSWGQIGVQPDALNVFYTSKGSFFHT